jgi:ABC-2 type transport system ATP-binding protein
MIKLENISKSFGTIKAVDGTSVDVPKGEITIITGADGAGKSTLLKIIIGLVKEDSGQIYLEGTPINGKRKIMESICGYMPEQFSLYLDLSVEENMNFFADIHKVPYSVRERRKNQLLEKTGMKNFKSRRAGQLSGGMKQKLALSTILLAAPELIILDEPTTGVDPLSRIEFFNIINDLKEEGKTLIISTPYLEEAEKGDYIVFFRNGKIIKKDYITNLKRSFPATLYKILPKSNVFDLWERATRIKELKNSIFIKGKYLRYLKTSQNDYTHLLPIKQIEEESPTLEDIYLYYVREDV